jgi:hypothetical protein
MVGQAVSLVVSGFRQLLTRAVGSAFGAFQLLQAVVSRAFEGANHVREGPSFASIYSETITVLTGIPILSLRYQSHRIGIHCVGVSFDRARNQTHTVRTNHDPTSKCGI